MYRNPFLCLMILVMTTLAACGGDSGSDDDGNRDALQPDITFSPASVAVPGGTRLNLIIRNRTSSNVDNVHVEYFFPAGVQILGGSVGTLCPFVMNGGSTANGYQFEVPSLFPNTDCGIFMDITVNTAGDKVFQVPAGSATGTGSSNRLGFAAILDVQ